MEDRLALLSTVDGSKTPPRTDTLAQLLAQVDRPTNKHYFRQQIKQPFFRVCTATTSGFSLQFLIAQIQP